MIIEKIKNNYLYYTNSQVIHTKEYYDYIVTLLKKWLLNDELNLNVIFGDYSFDFKNTNKTIKIDIQCEHTLVKDGGRSVNQKIFGNVKSDDGYYLIRIHNFNYLNTLDLVIEYSNPNVYNISTNEVFGDFLSKILYIPPTLYNLDFKNEGKKDITCLFVKDNNERRTNLLNSLFNKSLPVKTETNCFDKKCLIELYKKTKILVNVHQTDHHHTFEELRVLPALFNGVIIISEDVPLKDKIPYNEFIIWSDYDKISDKVKEVYENYEFYYNKIFVNSNLSEILVSMDENNNKIFEKLKI